MWKKIIQFALPPSALEQWFSNVSMRGWLIQIAGPYSGSFWLSTIQRVLGGAW